MATRRNESRAWVWPWGKGKKKAARPAKAVKPVSAKAVAKQAKEREDERLERKMSDAQFETKLRKHYARGGNLREFLQANPGAVVKCHLCRKPLEIQHTLYRESDGRLVHDYCKRTRGNPSSFRYDVPYQILDSNAKSIAGFETEAAAFAAAQKMAKAGQRVSVVWRGADGEWRERWFGKRAARSNPERRGGARGNPEKGYYVHGLHGMKTPTLAGHYWTKVEAVKAAQRAANEENETISVSPPGRGAAMLRVAPKGVAAVKAEADKLKRNPSDEAAAVYEEFHGRPSEEVVRVKEKVHYYKEEDLAALGELRTLVVQARDGAKVTLSKFRKAILCTNEAKNQMFVRGGDQAVDLAAFGIKKPHEVETLGRVLELAYFTTKTHLGDEGGTAVYFHVTGETNENGKRKMAGWAPDLIYRVLDESLEFSGGSYSIRAEGVDK